MGGGQGGIERRIEVFVKNKKENEIFFYFFFFWGGRSGRVGAGSGLGG